MGGEEDAGTMESKIGIARVRGEVISMEGRGSDTCKVE
jgi:hypothetical protein